MKKRIHLIKLSVSLRFAKEYLQSLNDMNTIYTEEEIQISKKLSIQYRALWVALIVEIGKLFDTYETKKVISFKKINIPKVKEKIDKIHGNVIIRRIIETRHSFTTHLGQEEVLPISISEICSSNLVALLDELEDPLEEFENLIK